MSVGDRGGVVGRVIQSPWATAEGRHLERGDDHRSKRIALGLGHPVLIPLVRREALGVAEYSPDRRDVWPGFRTRVR
jgi:hypothetical protein